MSRVASSIITAQLWAVRGAPHTAQLLPEFVAGPWLDDLDLDGMEHMNAKFHAKTSERRDGDMIWRIPRRDGGDTYLVLLLEFQSSPNHWMALRALVHAGLLRQLLVKEQRLPPDGRLPPILPIVLYSGDRRWVAPVALHALIGLPENSPLWRWQPDLRDHMIDEGTFGEADVERHDALPALLFRMESRPIWSRLLPSPTRCWLGSCATWGLRRCGPSLANCSAA